MTGGTGYWSDAMNTASGHELWLTDGGEMACITLLVLQGDVARFLAQWPDLQLVGTVRARVRAFPAGAPPLAPGPPGVGADGDGADADAD